MTQVSKASPMADFGRPNNSSINDIVGSDDGADIFRTLMGGGPPPDEEEEEQEEAHVEYAEGEVAPGWERPVPESEPPAIAQVPQRPGQYAPPPAVAAAPAPVPPSAAAPVASAPAMPVQPVAIEPGAPVAPVVPVARMPRPAAPPSVTAMAMPVAAPINLEPAPPLPEGGGALLREFVTLRHRVASLGGEVDEAAARAQRAMEEALRLQAEYQQLYAVHGQTYEMHAEATRRLATIELATPEDAALGVEAAMELIEDLSTGGEESTEVAARMRRVLQEALKVLHAPQAGAQPVVRPAESGAPVRLSLAGDAGPRLSAVPRTPRI